MNEVSVESWSSVRWREVLATRAGGLERSLPCQCLTRKAFCGMRKVLFIVLQKNSQERLQNENGNAGNYLPTLSPEPKNPNSWVFVSHMQLPQFQCGSTQGFFSELELQHYFSSLLLYFAFAALTSTSLCTRSRSACWSVCSSHGPSSIKN